jgi:hypothetical protein
MIEQEIKKLLQALNRYNTMQKRASYLPNADAEFVVQYELSLLWEKLTTIDSSYLPPSIRELFFSFMHKVESGEAHPSELTSLDKDIRELAEAWLEAGSTAKIPVYAQESPSGWQRRYDLFIETIAIYLILISAAVLGQFVFRSTNTLEVTLGFTVMVLVILLVVVDTTLTRRRHLDQSRM